MVRLRARLVENDEGQTYVEYALILAALVAVLLTIVATPLGTAIQNAVDQVSNAIAS